MGLAAEVHPRAAGEWEQRLLNAKRVSTYRLAIELLYLHWYGKGKPISVTGRVAKASKLSVRSKSNALAELEQLGLIEVERGLGGHRGWSSAMCRAGKSWARSFHVTRNDRAHPALKTRNDRAQGVPIIFLFSLFSSKNLSEVAFVGKRSSFERRPADLLSNTSGSCAAADPAPSRDLHLCPSRVP